MFYFVPRGARIVQRIEDDEVLANTSGQDDMNEKRPLRRFIRMPGVRDLENRYLLDTVAGDEHLDGFMAECNRVLRDLFGITRSDTIFKTPDAYANRKLTDDERYDLEDLREEWEERFQAEELGWDEHRQEYLKMLGWDLSDDDGKPLRITRYVCRVIEAVAKGIAGTAPDAEIIARDTWAAQIQKEAAQFSKKSRSGRS
jgi:PAS domain-containing protein